MAPGDIRQPALAHSGRFTESERPKTELSWRRSQLQPLEYVGGTQVNLLARLSNDIVEHILSFLSFRSIVAFSSTCTSEMLRDRFRLCSVLADQRWRHSVEDKGAGRSIPFRLTTSRNWKRTLIAREYTQSCFVRHRHPVEKVNAILKCLIANQDCDYFLLESLRWIVQLFDEFGEEAVSQVSMTYTDLNRFMFRLSLSRANRDLQHLAVKVIGILALNETTRKLLPSTGAVAHTLDTIRMHDDSTDLVENGLWTLVILGRPIGSVEGTPFPQQRGELIEHVNAAFSNGAIPVVLNIAGKHADVPTVLGKAFWAIVNLSLLDCNKEALVAMNAIELIVSSMKRFPRHRELQFRACFALINLSIPVEGRTLIRETGGIERVCAAMNAFPNFAKLQRCACNVLLSLAWNSHTNRERIAQLEAVQLVSAAAEKFHFFQDIVHIARTLISLMD